jgi:hypothetical protein
MIPRKSDLSCAQLCVDVKLPLTAERQQDRNISLRRFVCETYMDVVIYSSPEELSSLLESLGFRVSKRPTHYDAKLKHDHGRFHIKCRSSDNKMVCDLHYDRSLHFLGLGVDYKHRPRQFYEDVLRPALRSRGLESRVVIFGSEALARR